MSSKAINVRDFDDPVEMFYRPTSRHNVFVITLEDRTERFIVDADFMRVDGTMIVFENGIKDDEGHRHLVLAIQVSSVMLVHVEPASITRPRKDRKR